MAKLEPTASILSPLDDRIFKLLLTHADSKPILIDIITSIIGRQVTDVVVKNNELPAMDTDEKQERLDVTVR